LLITLKNYCHQHYRSSNHNSIFCISTVSVRTRCAAPRINSYISSSHSRTKKQGRFQHDQDTKNLFLQNNCFSLSNLGTILQHAAAQDQQLLKYKYQQLESEKSALQCSCTGSAVAEGRISADRVWRFSAGIWRISNLEAVIWKSDPVQG
jgi:hypothetical protein